ncbi:SDR family NAD(P)-dependent oxidoreductase [Microbacterium sp. LMI1-1-1.1]|uniref:SDR family NAD(P)-dependent oxidoreductase n=1 Tax=Microbacterium sp. LMI1-1-1.1 TaxID=3135223 RepID=UPI003467057D
MTTFDATSTADDVLAGVDLRGKRALVTGTSSGIGLETARALTARGADVIGTVRDLSKVTTESAQIQAAGAVNGGTFEAMELELGSLDSVRAFTDRLLSDAAPLDIMIANAGVGLPPFGHTADGFETQFGVNHLGHFVLVNRLVPLMHEGTRVVVLSSVAHRFADADFSDPNFENTPYDPMIAYARSKTANALFAVEFDQRHRGEGIRAVSVNPGSVQSNLERHLPADQRTPPPGEAPEGVIGIRKTAAQGAASSVWAAVVADMNEIGGRYCADCAVSPVNDDPNDFAAVTSAAQDPDRARALWEHSEKLVGERFPR